MSWVGGMDHSVLITMHDSDQGPGLSGQSSMGDPGRQSGPASIAVPPVPPSSPLLRHEVQPYPNCTSKACNLVFFLDTNDLDSVLAEEKGC